MTPPDKYRQLVRRLFERTMERKISWEYDQGVGVYTWLAGRLVKLSSTRHDGDPYEIVAISDENGNSIEEFNDGLISDAKVPIDGFEGSWSFMKTLRETAHRQAIGADVAVDDILGALGED